MKKSPHKEKSDRGRLQIILAGVGGQGILFSSRIFSEWGLKSGSDIIGSETHGMSQRGGSVIAHLKIGRFHSPMIREGNADILYSFEENETYKTLKFLKDGGICFANLEQTGRFDGKVLSYLKKKETTFLAFNATGAAIKIGSVMSTNIVLIGFSVGTGLVPFTYEEMKSVLESLSKGKHLALNLKAFDRGVQEGEKIKKIKS